MSTIIGATNHINLSVNSLGKYLYKMLDGSYKIEFKPNKCIIHTRMYYQVPHEDPLMEISFWIDITTYQNKLRLNLTEDTPMEKTIGQIIVTDKDLEDLTRLKIKVLKAIDKFISKEFDEYEFIY